MLESFELLVRSLNKNDEMTIEEFFEYVEENYPKLPISELKEEILGYLDTHDTIKDYLAVYVSNTLSEFLNDSDLIYWHNKHCDETRNYESKIYDTETFWADVWTGTPEETARACYYGSYAPDDNYIRLDSNGNIKTFNDVYCEIFEEEIAETIVENPEFLEEFLNEYC